MTAKRLVVLGGGPAGHAAATHAARFGVEVTLVERDIVGGTAHLRDCVPSKTMISTGSALWFAGHLDDLGLATVTTVVDAPLLRLRIADIENHLATAARSMLASQGVRMISGTGRLAGPNDVVATTDEGDIELHADAVVLATGSRPRIPDWASVDGERVLTTRDAYPPVEMPEHLVVVGSGVTGVEFVHMFISLGSQVTLIVSRQQVLPHRDPEAAAILEQTFIDAGVKLLKGARATGIERNGDEVVVDCDDGRVARGTHALIAIGSVPNSDDLGLEHTAVEVDEHGYIDIDHNLQSSEPSVYAAGDLSGKLPLSSVAAMQGRKIAEHFVGMHDFRPHRDIDYDKAASAIFTDPEIAEVGLAEAEAFATGRKIRVTKVPFNSNAKALIDERPHGFVKIVSDPLTGQVLGGSIVGHHAGELISVVALAVNAGLAVNDIAESLFVYPSLCEAISEAAE
ncbi:MAG TPA: NADPH:quinone reductase [Acidimicrobiaceae bacterium]|nr:NADPH:quinone reductase [Acidimicrobiaceae bacterium]